MYSIFGNSGAGSGIGRAVCRKLAEEGAKIIACDKNLKTVEDTVGLLEGETNEFKILYNKTKESFKKLKERFLNNFLCISLISIYR